MSAATVLHRLLCSLPLLRSSPQRAGTDSPGVVRGFSGRNAWDSGRSAGVPSIIHGKPGRTRASHLPYGGLRKRLCYFADFMAARRAKGIAAADAKASNAKNPIAPWLASSGLGKSGAFLPLFGRGGVLVVGGGAALVRSLAALLGIDGAAGRGECLQVFGEAACRALLVLAAVDGCARLFVDDHSNV